jgi:hypothetical protein
MTVEKQIRARTLWLFAALAIVFSPALDASELRAFEAHSLTDSLGPRILAPVSVDAVARDDRSTTAGSLSKSAPKGLPAFFILPAALVAAVLVAQRQRPVESREWGSRRTSRGPPQLAA